MAIEIKDATGTGNGMKVDGFGRALTFSTSTAQEHHAVGLGVNFMFSSVAQAITLTLPTPQSGTMLWLRNNNAGALLVVSKITIGSDRAGVAVKYIKNSVLGTPTDNLAGTAANLNFQSGIVAQSTLHIWDETGAGIGGLSGGTDIGSYTVDVGKTTDDIEGGIDLASGNSLGIHMNNSTTGTAEVSVMIRAFFESVPVPNAN